MTAKNVYAKVGKKVFHIPYDLVKFYDRYMKGRVEMTIPNSSWIGNMAVEVAGYLREQKVSSNSEFQYCDKNGEIIYDEKFSAGLHWAKDE